MGQESAFWVFLESPTVIWVAPASNNVADNFSGISIWNDFISVSWFWTGVRKSIGNPTGLENGIEIFIGGNGICYLAYSLSQVFST